MHKKVVVFGGGTGISSLLKGLKDFPLQITAIISVSDSGNSAGKLRREFNTPAVGDLRKVMSHLSTMDATVQDLLEYRFHTKSDLNGHALGNLILTALFDMTGSLKDSIFYLSQLFGVKHTILPLSEDADITLMAETVDHTILEEEAVITKSPKKIKRLFYKKEPHVLKEVLDAIEEADMIVFSMGSLFTSILPHLLIQDIQKALDKSKAPILYLCNIVTQPGETDGFQVSDHVVLLNEYLGTHKIDAVVANKTEISKHLAEKYATEEQKDPVKIDYEKLALMDVELLDADLLTVEEGTLRHDSLRLGAILFNYLMR